MSIQKCISDIKKKKKVRIDLYLLKNFLFTKHKQKVGTE